MTYHAMLRVMCSNSNSSSSSGGAGQVHGGQVRQIGKMGHIQQGTGSHAPAVVSGGASCCMAAEFSPTHDSNRTHQYNSLLLPLPPLQKVNTYKNTNILSPMFIINYYSLSRYYRTLKSNSGFFFHTDY